MKSILLVIIFLAVNSLTSVSQSVVNSVHNLSVSGQGEIRSNTETEICIFCHTNHNGMPESPLWNRKLSGTVYKLYNSSTLEAAPGQPDGSSILCLSCHDGTIAPGHVNSRKDVISFGSGQRTLRGRKSDLSTDLSDDHIISTEFNSALSFKDKQLKDPAILRNHVKLEKGKLQCTSCHNPHDNSNSKFLVVSNRNSDLCLNCHSRTNWESSAHKTSNKKISGSQKSHLFNDSYTTIAENACENCHVSHSAGSEEHLLREQTEENTCFICHDGTIAEKNIQEQINKPYSHNVYSYYKDHSAGENPNITIKHVECQDCHNPHAANNSQAEAPFVKGNNYGTTGIDLNGNAVIQVQYQYEICFKCHADSPNKNTGRITRQIEQSNVRLEFNPANPSYHPIAAIGKNQNVSSLLYPLNENSIIYCTDCHSSNGENSPAGPHGSIYPQLLRYNYSVEKNTPESYKTYELCYKCHDRNEIINGAGEFQTKVHRKHVSELQTSCSVCHDPHGISYMQGNMMNNSHLINFDLSEVSPINGQLKFIDNGNYSGTCYLKCHGKSHNPQSYK